jgi:hypothetical protein
MANANRTVELLGEASLWLSAIVSPESIEDERQRLEGEYDALLAVYEITKPLRHGVVCTRVEWEVL